MYTNTNYDSIIFLFFVANFQPELNLPLLTSTESIGNIKLAKYGKVAIPQEYDKSQIILSPSERTLSQS